MGLAAFALTTFVLSMVNSGILPATVEPVVFGLALAYGGIGQLLAGMWEFAKGNTFGATAFSSYGAFWISFWWLTGHTPQLGAAGADAAKGVGTYLLAWAIFTAYMTVAATRVSGAVLAVFAAADRHVPPARDRRVRDRPTRSTTVGGYVGLADRRSPPGTRRSPASRPSRTASRWCPRRRAEPRLGSQPLRNLSAAS